MLAAAVAIVATLLIQLAIQVPVQRNDASMHFKALASVLAANTADAAADEDGVTATAVLAGLRSEPDVEQTLLLGPTGAVIASFSATGHIESEGVLGERDGWMQTALAQSATTVRITGLTRTEIVAPVLQDGELLGHVYLSGSLRPVRGRITGFLIILGLAGGLSLAVAAWLARKMRRRVTGPLHNLQGAMRAVARNCDYGLRLAHAGDDELGGLVDGFNAMLSRIAERDQELQRHREMLESVAAERALALDQANKTVADLGARLASAQQTAEAGHTEKHAFLQSATQELRISLNCLMSMTDLLQDAAPAAPPGKLAEALLHSADSLLAIANEIAGYCVSEGACRELERAEFDFRKLVEEVALLFAQRAQDKGLELVVAVDPQIRQLLHGDAARVRQILMNLISNAIKFTMRGSVLVRVTLLSRESQRVLVRIEVIDTGIGIRRENRASLFEPVARQESTALRPNGGGGQGMAVSRQMVSLMGGHIAVESDFGRGTTFAVDLRLEESPEPCRSGREIELDPGRRALVVVDSALLRDALQAQLLSFGMKVSLAPSLDNAVSRLALAEARGTALELLVVDDVETLRQLRAQSAGRAPPAVLLLPIAQELPDELQAELAPVLRLSKPVRHGALQGAVVRLLGHLEAAAELDILTRGADAQPAAISAAAAVVAPEDLGAVLVPRQHARQHE